MKPINPSFLKQYRLNGMLSLNSHLTKKIIVIGLMLFLSLSFIVNTQLQAQSSVDSLLVNAIQNHPTIAVAMADIDRQHAIHKQQGYWSDPKLQVGFGILPIETRLGAQQLRLGLQQAIPRIGSLRLQKEKISNLTEATEWQYVEEVLQLRLQLQTLIAEYQSSTLQKGIYTEYSTLLQTKEELLINAIKNDQKEYDTWLRFQQKKYQIKADSSQNELEQDYILRTLHRLTKVDINKIEDWLADGLVVETPKNQPNSVHPRIRLKDALIASNKATLASVKQKYRPSMIIGIDYWMIQERNGLQIQNNGRDVLAPNIGLQLPIFRKRIDAEVSEVQIMQDRIFKEKEAIQLELNQVIDQSYNQLRRWQIDKQRLDDQLQLLDQERQWLKKRISTENEALSLVDVDLTNQAKKLEIAQINLKISQTIARINYLQSAELKKIEQIITELVVQNK